MKAEKKAYTAGGGMPYGYKVVDRKIVIDSDRAEIVRYIYEQYSLGVYVPTIIKALTGRGVYRNGKPFALNTVYQILKNEKYLGIYRNKDEVFKNIYPQIVPTKIFDKVRRKVEKNKFGKRSTQTVYFLPYKLKCGNCGHPISAESGTSSNGEVIHYSNVSTEKSIGTAAKKQPFAKSF